MLKTDTMNQSTEVEDDVYPDPDIVIKYAVITHHNEGDELDILWLDNFL